MFATLWQTFTSGFDFDWGNWLIVESELALRLTLAAVLGGVIGLERGAHGRSAGLRTQMLVATGSALAMAVSLHFADVFGSGSGGEAIRVDPARVAYGVMGGVGFLGAGAVMRFGSDIKGLTTAASLWCTAAVGLACGFGMYLLSLWATLLILATLALMRVIDKHLPHPSERELTIVLRGNAGEADARITALLDAKGIHAVNIGLDSDTDSSTVRMDYIVRMKRSAHPAELLKLLEHVPQVQEIKLH